MTEQNDLNENIDEVVAFPFLVHRKVEYNTSTKLVPKTKRVLPLLALNFVKCRLYIYWLYQSFRLNAY